MRLLSVPNKKQPILEELSSKFKYIIDEADDIEDSRNYLMFRSYDLMIIFVEGSDKQAKKLAKDTRIPVIVLSEDNSKTVEIEYLNAGASDFIKVPFDLDIIGARINALLKYPIGEILEIGDLTLDLNEEQVIYKDKEINLRGKPFQILTYLVRNKNKVISKTKLLNAIWEEPEFVTPNVIEIAINTIRNKIDKQVGTQYIETIRRRGYKFCDGTEEA
jgi:two-component system OmpR family response regulator